MSQVTLRLEVEDKVELTDLLDFLRDAIHTENVLRREHERIEIEVLTVWE